MKIIFAGLKTTGKVETVWALISLDQIREIYPGYRARLKELSGGDRYSDIAIIWGRRGGKLQYTVQESVYVLKFKDIIYTDAPSNLLNDYSNSWLSCKLVNMVAIKHRKGYISVKAEQLSDVYPEFEADLNKICFWENLKLD